MQSQPAIEYRSPKTLSSITMFLLGGLFVINLLNMFFSFGEIYFYRDIELAPGENMSVWLLLIGLVGIVQVLVYIATFVFFLVWLFRVYKNLTPLRAPNPEYTPGWAVGWWFIPFANLVKPFQVVREAWLQSDPDFDSNLNFLSNSISAPVFFGFWWGFWLLSNIAGNIVSRIDPEGSGMGQSFAIGYIISSILTMIASVLAIMVVKSITERQEQRYQNLFNMQVYAPPPPPVFNPSSPPNQQTF
jgi:Domain of unknown function (DUF4328)